MPHKIGDELPNKFGDRADDKADEIYCDNPNNNPNDREDDVMVVAAGAYIPVIPAKTAAKL